MTSIPLRRHCCCVHLAQRRSFSSGYKSIGSFHSENVEDLMRQDKATFVPPPLPFQPLPTPQADFLLKNHEWTFINHGAFGASLGVAYDRAQQWRQYLEEQPLRFFDRDLLPHLVYSARRIAHFTNASSRQGIALLPNVTSGLNAVISGYVRYYGKEHAKILLWDVSYGSVKKMTNAYCNPQHVTEVPLQEEFLERLQHETDFIQAFEHTINSKPIEYWNNALFLMDHTSSNTAINFPIRSIAKRAKELGMITVVDGAHGLLAQNIDLTALEESIDIYLSNGHKWLSCPRGVAFMYCQRKEIRETILRYPAVISHGVDDGYFSRFIWDGCRDYAAQLTLPVVLDHWETLDPNKVRAQISEGLTKVVELLAQQWHPHHANPDSWTGNVTLLPMSLHGPMVLVKLPDSIYGCSDPRTSTDAKKVQDYLYSLKIEAPIKCINGILYVRLSYHVYNYLEQYDILAQAILKYNA